MPRINYKWPTKVCTRIITDYQRSSGATLVDASGKRYLDMYGSIASLPLGYNHPSLVQLAKRSDPSVFIHKPATGFFPPKEYPRLMDRVIKMSGLPHNMFYTFATGSEAVENSLKLAYLRKKRCGGTSEGKVLSLETGFHGRTLGALSATHTKIGYKKGFPAFPWLKLPVGDDEKTIQRLDELTSSEQVAACIIEPIQSEGGDVHMDPGLARKIRKMLYTAGVPLIVDEVQTGVGATGKMWAHQWWDLSAAGLAPPEFVVVSKKSQQAGVFLFEEDLPQEYYQIFNTWLGNPWDLAKFELILETIHADGLLAQVADTGEYLLKQLAELVAQEYPISGLRGLGTMIAFDVAHPSFGNKDLMAHLQRNGVIVGVCGAKSIRLRPALTITRTECDQFIRILRQTLREMSQDTSDTVEILRSLHGHYHHTTQLDHGYTIDHAAAEGNLNAVKMLHANNKLGCTTLAMDRAAAGGHLLVVQWLHENRGEGCTTNAMDWAAREGHLETVQWLHANRSEGCTTRAMDWAAQGGHLQVVQWLHANYGYTCSQWVLDDVARKDHKDDFYSMSNVPEININRFFCVKERQKRIETAKTNGVPTLKQIDKGNF